MVDIEAQARQLVLVGVVFQFRVIHFAQSKIDLSNIRFSIQRSVSWLECQSLDLQIYAAISMIMTLVYEVVAIDHTVEQLSYR